MSEEIVTIKDWLGNERKIKQLDNGDWIQFNAPYGNNDGGKYLVPIYSENEYGNYKEKNPIAYRKNERRFKVKEMVDRRTYGV